MKFRKDGRTMTPYQYRKLEYKLSKVWHYVKSIVLDILMVIAMFFYIGLLLYIPSLIAYIF